jgi:hypothetical protein
MQNAAASMLDHEELVLLAITVRTARKSKATIISQ